MTSSHIDQIETEVPSSSSYQEENASGFAYGGSEIRLPAFHDIQQRQTSQAQQPLFNPEISRNSSRLSENSLEDSFQTENRDQYDSKPSSLASMDYRPVINSLSQDQSPYFKQSSTPTTQRHEFTTKPPLAQKPFLRQYPVIDDQMEQLPNRIRGIFKFSSFNKMQKEAFNPIFNQPHNCVISSPTGSGKTVLFELAIIRLFLNKDCIDLNNNMKVLYIAPTKALCSERLEDWSKKFNPLNISVGMLTSDTASFETEKVKSSNIIISTPEKWDLLTRRWFDYIKLFNLVRLLLLDEIHVIKDTRGAVLEVVTTRMNRMCKNLRIIALSATVPNISDISQWLKKSSDNKHEKALTLIFGEEYRPVKINKIVYGYRNSTDNDFMFDSSLNSKLLEILRQQSHGKPVLIFCATRKIASNTAQYLSTNMEILPFGGPQKPFVIQDREANALAQKGVAFHHAGLPYKDRTTIESNFLEGNIKILCSTSTLAVGVNLPAYLVIIKGTRCWVEGQFAEYSELDILQMMGRAGRPQFETEGAAVIMTQEKNKKKYERLLQGTEKLESCLHLNMYEHLAAEVALKTVVSVESAVDWLSSTFFYTRYRLNPTAYEEIQWLREINLDTRLALFCAKQLSELANSKIIQLDPVSKRSYSSTPFGDAMSRHYVLFETMKKLVRAPPKLQLNSILELFSKADEFKELKIKRAEQRLFREISASPLIKYALKTKTPNQPFAKVFLLVQYELGGLEFPNYKGSQKLYYNFNTEKMHLFKQSSRLLRCMVDTFVEKKDATSLLNTLNLGRSMAGKCWEDTAMMLRQLEGIGLAYVRKFMNHNIMSFEQASKLNDNKIEHFLGMKPGNGQKVLKDIASIPKLSVKCQFISYSVPRDEAHVNATFSVTAQCLNPEKITHWHRQLVMVNIVTTINNGELVDFRRIFAGKLQSAKSFILSAKLTDKSQKIQSYISCEEIANTYSCATLNTRIPETAFERLPALVSEEMILAKEEDSDFSDEDSDFDKMIIEFTSKEPQKTLLTNKSGGLTSKKSTKSMTIEPVIIVDLQDAEAVSSTGTYNKQAETSYLLRSDGHYECKHNCKNKAQCRHLCCKDGLPTIPRKRSASKEIKSLSQSQKNRKVAEVPPRGKQGMGNSTSAKRSSSTRATSFDFDSQGSNQKMKLLPEKKKNKRNNPGGRTRNEPIEVLEEILSSSDIDIEELNRLADDALAEEPKRVFAKSAGITGEDANSAVWEKNRKKAATLMKQNWTNDFYDGQTSEEEMEGENQANKDVQNKKQVDVGDTAVSISAASTVSSEKRTWEVDNDDDDDDDDNLCQRKEEDHFSIKSVSQEDKFKVDLDKKSKQGPIGATRAFNTSFDASFQSTSKASEDAEDSLGLVNVEVEESLEDEEPLTKAKQNNHNKETAMITSHEEGDIDAELLEFLGSDVEIE